jgi:hypothetical protein
LEPYLQDYKCFNEILQIKFLQYIVFFLSRDVLNQFQLRACNVYPPPPKKFLYGFSLFERMVFVAIGGRSPPPPPPPPPPPLATPLKESRIQLAVKLACVVVFHRKLSSSLLHTHQVHQLVPSLNTF